MCHRVAGVRQNREGDVSVALELQLRKGRRSPGDTEDFRAKTIEAFNVGVQLEQVADAGVTCKAQVKHHNHWPALELLVQAPSLSLMALKSEIGSRTVKQRMDLRL